MNDYEDIRKRLKIKFGLPTNSPSYEELKNILLTIRELKPEERTEKRWGEAVYKYVENAGTYKYLGLDTKLNEIDWKNIMA